MKTRGSELAEKTLQGAATVLVVVVVVPPPRVERTTYARQPLLRSRTTSLISPTSWPRESLIFEPITLLL
jgi:hypothetical protein